MLTAIKKLFPPKSVKRRDFSSFFTNASPKEKEKLLREVVRQANKDQQDLMERYTCTSKS